jgi:DNA-binding CsgD family transcriptional regulator
MGEPNGSGGALPEATRARLVELIALELGGAWDAAVAAGAPAAGLIRVIDARRRLIGPDRRPDPGLPAGATVREDGAMATVGDASRAQRDRTARPFVGRAAELERLRSALQAAGDGRPSTVLLEGEPGVGKSRLVQRYCEQARDSGARLLAGACVHLGEAQPSDGGFPYAPLIDALRLFVREHREQAPAVAGPAWPELEGLIRDFTGTDTPGGLGDRGATGSQRQIFGAVMRLLDHLGAQAPVLVVFEDLHWADPSTLALVEYLTRFKSDQRMVLLCSTRTEFANPHPLRRLLAEHDFTRRTERIRLDPFDRHELLQFLGALGPVDAELIRRTFARSGGNALFAEELYTTRSGDDSALPASLQALMDGRIDLAGPDAARVLSIAATAGRRVSEALLVTVSGMDDDALAVALRACLDQGLLVADRADDSYHFRHALLSEAAYDRLTGFQRRKLHLAMAEAITADTALSLDPALAAVELAHHWFAGGRKPEALAAAVQAGTANLRMRAFREAEMQYKRALQLWPAVPGAARLAGVARDAVLVAVADAARWAGHVGAAVEFMLTAIDEIDPRSDPRRAAELTERLGSYQWEAGAYDESAATYRRAMEMVRGGPDDALKARVLAVLATDAVRAGQYTAGRDRAREAARVAEQAGARAEQGRALSTLGVALAMLGQAHEGIRLLRHALKIARETGHLEDLLRTHANLEVALEDSGALAEAVEAGRQGLEDARRFDLADTRQGGILANNTSVALSKLGRWNEAVALLDEALLAGPPVRQSTYLRLTKAEIEVARGGFAVAERLLDEVRQQGVADPRFLEPQFACQAELELWRGDLPAAQATAERGIAAVGKGQNELAKLRLHAIGLRATADTRREAADRREVGRRAERQLGDVPVVAPDADGEAAALRRLCEAEAARAGGDDTADGWAEVARCWKALDRPYPAAYARWREAAAAHTGDDAHRAARVAQVALDTAGRLGAEPLRAALARLQSEIGGSQRLTERELEVLAALGNGGTYKQIGAELFMAEDTVAVHVRNARTKLGLADRRALIAWARENL